MNRTLLLTSILILVIFLSPLPQTSAHAVSFQNASTEEKETLSHTRELIFKIANFAILVGGLTFLLRKPLVNFLAQRKASIKKELEEGKHALQQSRSRIKEIEATMEGLNARIVSLSEEADREEEADRVRLREIAHQEADRILTAARHEIEIATQAAQVKLNYYTVREAVHLAEEILRQRMDKEHHSSLVDSYVADIEKARN